MSLFSVANALTTSVLHECEAFGTEHFAEGVPEHQAERAVQNKVDGGVEGQQRVGDLADAFHLVVLLHVALAEEGGHDGVRRDADDEGDDDGDQHEGDAVARGEFLALDPLLAQHVDDASVEVDEDEDRDDTAHQVLSPGVRNHNLYR